MKLLLAMAMVGTFLAGCSSLRNSDSSAARAAEAFEANRFTEDEKHRLYSAALATSESPLDGELFSDVCKKIEIYDGEGKPTDKYMPFVQAHIDWFIRSENEQFRQEINSKDKAREYIHKRLSQP